MRVTNTCSRVPVSVWRPQECPKALTTVTPSTTMQVVSIQRGDVTAEVEGVEHLVQTEHRLSLSASQSQGTARAGLVPLFVGQGGFGLASKVSSPARRPKGLVVVSGDLFPPPWSRVAC